MPILDISEYIPILRMQHGHVIEVVAVRVMPVSKVIWAVVEVIRGLMMVRLIELAGGMRLGVNVLIADRRGGYECVIRLYRAARAEWIGLME